MLSFVTLVRKLIDTYLPDQSSFHKILSEILFSMIPILILCKILYVTRIRQNGSGEYKTVVFRYLIFNFIYFFITLLCLAFYFSTFYFIGQTYGILAAFLLSLLFLCPLLYVMFYYSLSPVVAVFEDSSWKNTFIESKKLTSKKTSLVFINHLFSLMIPISFLSIRMIDDKELVILFSALLAVPEAILVILSVLTTVRIYLFLSELD